MGEPARPAREMGVRGAGTRTRGVGKRRGKGRGSAAAQWVSVSVSLRAPGGVEGRGSKRGFRAGKNLPERIDDVVKVDKSQE